MNLLSKEQLIIKLYIIELYSDGNYYIRIERYI